jgi:hypothetical protein
MAISMNGVTRFALLVLLALVSLFRLYVYVELDIERTTVRLVFHLYLDSRKARLH